MEDQELKFQVLRLAVGTYAKEHGVSIRDVANSWYEWLTGQDKDVVQGKSDCAPATKEASLVKVASLAEMAAYAKGRTDQAYGVSYNPFYMLDSNSLGKA
jgi:hypothetical protein